MWKASIERLSGQWMDSAQFFISPIARMIDLTSSYQCLFSCHNLYSASLSFSCCFHLESSVVHLAWKTSLRMGGLFVEQTTPSGFVQSFHQSLACLGSCRFCLLIDSIRSISLTSRLPSRFLFWPHSSNCPIIYRLQWLVVVQAPSFCSSFQPG